MTHLKAVREKIVGDVRIDEKDICVFCRADGCGIKSFGVICRCKCHGVALKKAIKKFLLVGEETTNERNDERRN